MPGFKPRPLASRIWPRLAPPNASGCREWRGCRNSQGYGRTGVGRRTVGAHRVAYCLAHGLDLGAIDGLDICHHCDNPACCEPTHLFAGTEKDNIADMMQKGRWGGAVGERQHSSKLTASAVREMRKLRAEGLTLEAIGTRFGVTKSTARKAIVGVYWRHIT